MALDRINATALLDGGVTSADLATQTGNVDFADGGRIRLGDSQDLQIYHNGNNSYIDDTGTGNLYIRASDTVRLQSATGEQGVIVTTDGAVTLYNDNGAKLATTATGVDVTGTVVTDGFELNTTSIGGDTFGVVKSANNTASGFDFLSDNSGTKGARVYYEGNGNLFTIAENTSGTIEPRLVIDDNGNVGIGPSSPSELLHINNASGDAAVRIDGSTRSFKIEQNNYGLRFVDVSAGSAERLRINAAGIVTMPYQPAFLAHPTSTITNLSTGANNTLAFATERFDQNSDYNNSTYTFTAPVTGKYQVNVVLYLNELDSAVTYYEFRLDTSNHVYYAIFDPDFGQDNAYFTLTFTALVDMDASDTADINLHQQGGSSQTDISSLSMWSMYLVA